jgi:hypothetical protein
MHTIQINALIRILASSARFEHHGFIIKKTVFTGSFCMFAGGKVCSNSLPPARCLHKYMKVITYKHCVYNLPDDEHMMLETCRRRQKSN